MEKLPKLPALLIIASTLCTFVGADLPPGTLELIKNNEVGELDLSEQGLNSEDAQKIGEALRHNTSLTNLDLSRNEIDVEGATCIMEALGSNTSLTHLKLNENAIICGDEADATRLLIPLTKNKTLKTLDLSQNILGGFCVNVILQIADENESLGFIDLSGNSIGNRHAKRMVLKLGRKWICDTRNGMIRLTRNVEEGVVNRVCSIESFDDIPQISVGEGLKSFPIKTNEKQRTQRRALDRQVKEELLQR